MMKHGRHQREPLTSLSRPDGIRRKLARNRRRAGAGARPVTNYRAHPTAVDLTILWFDVLALNHPLATSSSPNAGLIYGQRTPAAGLMLPEHHAIPRTNPRRFGIGVIGWRFLPVARFARSAFHATSVIISNDQQYAIRTPEASEYRWLSANSAYVFATAVLRLAPNASGKLSISGRHDVEKNPCRWAHF